MKVPHASKTLPASRSVLLRGDACILPEPPATFPQNSKPTVGDVKPQAPDPGTESDREAVACALVDPSNQQNLFTNNDATASTFPIGQDNTVGEGACEGANPDVCGYASFTKRITADPSILPGTAFCALHGANLSINVMIALCIPTRDSRAMPAGIHQDPEYHCVRSAMLMTRTLIPVTFQCVRNLLPRLPCPPHDSRVPLCNRAAINQSLH